MDPSEGPDRGTSPAGQDSGFLVKRRKLRKGTRSCWECKRRKIRCMFASPGDATCIGCQHRHVSCVPQELARDLTLVRRDNPSLGDRIARVEDFMNVFLAQRQDDGDRSVPRPPLLASPSASGNSSSVFHSPVSLILWIFFRPGNCALTHRNRDRQSPRRIRRFPRPIRASQKHTPLHGRSRPTMLRGSSLQPFRRPPTCGFCCGRAHGRRDTLA